MEKQKRIFGIIGIISLIVILGLMITLTCIPDTSTAFLIITMCAGIFMGVYGTCMIAAVVYDYLSSNLKKEEDNK